MIIYKSKIPQYIIVIMMIIGVGIHKLFIGKASYLADPVNVSIVLGIASMIICCYFLLRYRPSSEFIYIYLFIAVITAFCGVQTSLGNGKYFLSYDVFPSVSKWACILLAFPVYKMLSGKVWDFKRLLNTIVNLTMISIILRLFISVFHRMTGTVLFEAIVREYAAENWMRNDWLRINPPAFAVIIIPLLYYLMCEFPNQKKKYIAYISINLFYTAVIHGARAVILYQLMELIFLILCKRRSSLRKIAVFFAISFLVIVLVASPIGSNFINSFLAGSEFEGSTTGRMEALGAYLLTLKDNFWFGIGFLSYEEMRFIGKVGWTVATLPDLGILYSVVQLGFGALFFYVVFFLRSYCVGRKIKKRNYDSNDYLLVYGIALAIALTEINIDMFYGIYTFAVPFCIAICEYVNITNTSGEYQYN